MNSLFGAELPTAVNFVIAFVVVLVLIGAATWMVRRFGVTRLDATTRGRQPRLAVIDSAAVDGRRKLVIVRRDNVEHLLMIGGPTDVVVETNIVRAAATARDTVTARNGGAETAPRVETAPRAMPLPEPTPWPLQPEPAPVPAPAHAMRTDRGPRVVVDEPPHWEAPGSDAAAQPFRPARPSDPLAGLAAELARPAAEPAATARAGHAEPAQAAAPTTVAAAAGAPQAPAADQSLAEMAQRLEAALRRPLAQKAADRGAARVAIAAEPKPAAAPPKDETPQPAPNADLEQEMASLLGRPGKT